VRGAQVLRCTIRPADKIGQAECDEVAEPCECSECFETPDNCLPFKLASPPQLGDPLRRNMHRDCRGEQGPSGSCIGLGSFSPGLHLMEAVLSAPPAPAAAGSTPNRNVQNASLHESALSETNTKALLPQAPTRSLCLQHNTATHARRCARALRMRDPSQVACG